MTPQAADSPGPNRNGGRRCIEERGTHCCAHDLARMTGNGSPFRLRNPYFGINFITALQEVFPSRG